MKKTMLVATIFVIAALNAPVGFAQSSGSFNFASLPMQCVVNSSNGALTGGVGQVPVWTFAQGDEFGCASATSGAHAKNAAAKTVRSIDLMLADPC